MTPPTPHQYPAYKPSGVPWLGDLPEHWDVIPTRALLNLKKQLVGDRADKYTLLSLTKQGIIARDMENPAGKFPASFETYQVVEPGDLVFCLFDIDETPRTIGLSSMTGMITGAYTKFVCPNEQNRRFIYQLYLSLDNGKLLKPLYSGLRKVITKSTFLSATIPLPPLPEQRAIVRYLDYVNRRIRRYVTAKRKLIALLEEEKQAVVSRAVTRGLDPNVPLKPSGVEWLGDVPAHWDRCRLRNVVSVVTTGSRGWSSFASDTGPLFIRVANLNRGSLQLRFDDTVRLNLPETSEVTRTRIHAGDLLVSVTAYIGSVGLAPEELEEAYVSQHVARCQPLPGSSSRWLGYVLLSTVGQTHGQISLYGGTKDGLSLDDVKNYQILLPPLDEQIAIVEHVDKATAAVDAAIARARRQIELIQEYRTSLIANVVTGKLDVREVAAHLPDEDGEEEPIDGYGLVLDNTDDGSSEVSYLMEEKQAIKKEVTA